MKVDVAEETVSSCLFSVHQLYIQFISQLNAAHSMNKNKKKMMMMRLYDVSNHFLPARPVWLGQSLFVHLQILKNKKNC